ncbi:hypothetical protein F7725_012959 [Dissostichus mawsoni]|uniref:Uncharacterized protein n=1 Tax=Dissostichus mawsoni TaxID=36200 RepID=A0A7J5YRZ3_DISMA|nr:hypothetical protein F7725_012959 [Dissostichus mawsoni]
MASILPPLSPCPVQFPGDPHSLPGWPGWSGLRMGQVGSDKGIAYSLPPALTQKTAQTATAHPQPCLSPSHRLVLHSDCFTPLSQSTSSSVEGGQAPLEIRNQSFWWKNGVGLSITIPWVLPAEREVQKRLHTGTVEGKVNAADTPLCCLFTRPLYSPQKSSDSWKVLGVYSVTTKQNHLKTKWAAKLSLKFREMIKGEETVKHLKDLRTRAKVALGRKVNSVTKMVNTMLEEELMKEYGEVHKAAHQSHRGQQ